MKTAFLLAAVLLIGRMAGAQDVPSPPGQTRQWTAPPTSLPAVVVSAAAALFDQGMADPRECEYRVVEINLARPLKTHAWVLPADNGQARYAVGWNGLVYPVQSVGAPADLAADATAPPRWRFREAVEAVGESHALSVESTLRIKAALLLRLGEGGLAEKLWREGCGDRVEMARADPYADMAAAWLGSWYNRAVRAYLRDDYPAALAICRQLSPVLAKARETIRARGIPEPWPEHFDGLPFWQMPILMAEAQRRIDEPADVSALDSGQPAAGPERIAALIRDLELVRVQQSMLPGRTEVLDDAAVQALVRAGDAAVPALLRCLVEDQRLTRSRYTGGGWTLESGPIIPVYEAAYTALFCLFNTTFPLFEHGSKEASWEDRRWDKEPRDLSPDDRRALAAKLEAYWHQLRDEDPLERAYATLRDDQAGWKAWLQAVDEIVQPGDGTSTDYRLVSPVLGGYSIFPRRTPITPRGEALRGRTDPPVRELIIRRFEQLVADTAPFDYYQPGRQPDTPGKLLLSLAAWNGRDHPDDLPHFQGELVAQYRCLTPDAAPNSRRESDRREEARMIIRLYEKRLELGDPDALAGYADFLPDLTPYGAERGDEFRLLWRHPDDPAIVRAAEKMFGASSSWVPFSKRGNVDLKGLSRMPLVAVPAFRKELERGLGDTSADGQVTLAENGDLHDGPGRLERFNPLDPLAPAGGSKVDYRLCDDYARQLSFLDGFPECELYWPIADRDRAVAACRAFLDRYADNFRYRPEDKDEDTSYYAAPAHLHFQVLDHPATDEDVRLGRAIFSLPAPARLCCLPGMPVQADRPGRPMDPHKVTDETGRVNLRSNPRGCVWQAEETLVDGMWERFYGFVGRYQIEKVPAAEIEFPIGHLVADITPQISGDIEMTWRLVTMRRFPSAVYTSAASSLPTCLCVSGST